MREDEDSIREEEEEDEEDKDKRDAKDIQEQLCVKAQIARVGPNISPLPITLLPAVRKVVPAAAVTDGIDFKDREDSQA